MDVSPALLLALGAVVVSSFSDDAQKQVRNLVVPVLGGCGGVVGGGGTDPELSTWKELAAPVRGVPVLGLQKKERFWAPRVT